MKSKKNSSIHLSSTFGKNYFSIKKRNVKNGKY